MKLRQIPASNAIDHHLLWWHYLRVPINIFIEILNCLAIQSNIKTILNLSGSKDNLITSVHGLRVFSLLWTILVHTYLQSFFIGENKVLRKLKNKIFYIN
uniref:Uncharacterized protein n=1 Tax=Megaselia scalaris TaxID=36166 RepID=T1GEG7_MEGSC